MSHVEHSPELYCPGCGYDLRALMGDRCPECGLVVDRAAIAKSEIPWSHRARLGWVGAFLRTVWVTSTDSQLLSRQAAQPVSYRDAQIFRWIVVLLASLPLCITALAVRGMIPAQNMGINPIGRWPATPYPPAFDLAICALAGHSMWAVPSIAILLFIVAVTGMPSFFFHPGDLPVARQNRAVALSYYTCAPLALLAVPVSLLVVANLFQRFDLWPRQGWFQLFALIIFLGGFSLILVLLLFWWRAVRLLGGATHCTTTQLVISAILLPLSWVLMAGICLGLFPMIVGLVRLMIESLMH